jgi:RNA polymerase sigma factor (sigma-70 family)
MTENQNCLAEYARTGSETAFHKLVVNYVNLVYSTALRIVGGDTHRAEDVAQMVFANLARTAQSLPQDVKLGGWLHRDACFTASTLMRAERRRQIREMEAAEMNALEGNSVDDYSVVAPVLDEVIDGLDEADRTAILLRFFEQNDFRSVGHVLGSSEDAARMRVSRALEKLEGLLKRRGITTTDASLGILLSTNAIQAAPTGLAAALTGSCLIAGATLTATIVTKTTLTTMSWLNIKSMAAIAFAAAAAGTGTYYLQHQSVTQLKKQNTELLVEQEKLNGERAAALVSIKANREEIERLQGNQSEVMRLRGEVSRLRRKVETQPDQSEQKNTARNNLSKVALHAPGTYISKDEIAFAGYATPEAAMESISWVMFNGTLAEANDNISPEILAADRNKDTPESFEAKRNQMAPLIKGLQIIAKKVISDDKVELKIKMDADPLPGQQQPIPPYIIQPLVKVGDAWKIGGSGRNHKTEWDASGSIETFVR